MTKGRTGDRRRGVLLPMALFLVLALSACAVSILVLARNELLVAGEGLRYLRSRITAESRLSADGSSSEPADAAEGTVESRAEIELPGGYLLTSAPAPTQGPVYFGLSWRLEPSAIVSTLPGAVEVGADPPAGGVAALADGCPGGAGPAPLVRVRPEASPGAPLPDPPLPDPPRVGPLGIDRFLALSPVSIEDGVLNSGGPVFLRTSEGTSIGEGEAFGVLVASGDLVLRGEAVFRGLILARGDVLLREGARVEGVILAAGMIRIEDDAFVFGCPVLAGQALDQPTLNRSHPIAGGLRLGRY